ncbi:hypothetical protein [Nucisporomicrobium flavum]|nr:hypothetical protein [Nucisporomicrobium flavum]
MTYGPKVTGSDPYLSGLAAIPGTAGFWGVGASSDAAGEIRAVVERAG